MAYSYVESVDIFWSVIAEGAVIAETNSLDNRQLSLLNFICKKWAYRKVCGTEERDQQQYHKVESHQILLRWDTVQMSPGKHHCLEKQKL